MDGIKKFSKEWFATNGSEQIKNAQNLASGATKNVRSDKSINGSLFEGSLDDAKAKFEDMRSHISGMPPATFTNIQAYGLENIYNALDADGDGNVTAEEISAAASLIESDDNAEPTLTTDDLNQLYSNAMQAVDSSFVEDGNTTKITYANGDETTLNYDDSGNLLSRSEVSVLDDGSKLVLDSDYSNNSYVTSQYDNRGNLTSKTEDYEGVLNDKTTTYAYNDDGTKVETVDTIGKTTVSNIDKDGNVTDKNVTVKYDSDGVIGDTKQQDIGDCWVLAGVNALNNSTKGQQIIKDAIQHNEDGSVTVKLVGGGKEYTFSAEEIVLNQYEDGSTHYSVGDTDMNLIEMAIGRYRKENIQNQEATINPLDRAHHWSPETTEDDALSSGMVDEAVYLLTGTDAQYWIDPRIINADGLGERLLNKFQDNPDDYSMVCSFKKDDSASVAEGVITDHHVYSIKSIDDDNVYIVNPWDSSKTITYPRDKFMENVSDLSLTDLVEATTAEKLDVDKWDNKLLSEFSHAMGKVDHKLRPAVMEGIEEAKVLYQEGKEFVTDKIEDAKELIQDGKEFLSDKIQRAKNFFGF